MFRVQERGELPYAIEEPLELRPVSRSDISRQRAMSLGADEKPLGGNRPQRTHAARRYILVQFYQSRAFFFPPWPVSGLYKTLLISKFIPGAEGGLNRSVVAEPPVHIGQPGSFERTAGLATAN